MCVMFKSNKLIWLWFTLECFAVDRIDCLEPTAQWFVPFIWIQLDWTFLTKLILHIKWLTTLKKLCIQLHYDPVVMHCGFVDEFDEYWSDDTDTDFDSVSSNGTTFDNGLHCCS